MHADLIKGSGGVRRINAIHLNRKSGPGADFPGSPDGVAEAGKASRPRVPLPQRRVIRQEFLRHLNRLQITRKNFKERIIRKEKHLTLKCFEINGLQRSRFRGMFFSNLYYKKHKKIFGIPRLPLLRGRPQAGGFVGMPQSFLKNKPGLARAPHPRRTGSIKNRRREEDLRRRQDGNSCR